jgi:hypothetical protein
MEGVREHTGQNKFKNRAEFNKVDNRKIMKKMKLKQVLLKE